MQSSSPCVLCVWSLALGAVVCLSTPSGLAQQIAPGLVGSRSSAVRMAAGRGVPAARVTSVQGSAWRSDNTPIAFALVRLRDVVSGRIVASTVATEAGAFTFAGLREGTYLVEMVNEDGKVLVVGHTFTIAPGESVATFVRLGPKVTWFSGFFANAARMVLSSAAAVGVTALAPESMTPVSSVR